MTKKFKLGPNPALELAREKAKGEFLVSKAMAADAKAFFLPKVTLASIFGGDFLGLYIGDELVFEEDVIEPRVILEYLQKAGIIKFEQVDCDTDGDENDDFDRFPPLLKDLPGRSS